jgi:hypothetical protein
MARRLSLALLVASTLGVAISYAAAFLPGGAPRWAPWLLALAVPAMMVAMMVLGAVRPGRRLGGLALPLALTFVLVAGGLALALALPPERAGDPLWLGLPRRAAVLIYGVGLLPMLVLPIAYARTFDSHTLSEADLAEVRARCRELAEREAERGAAPRR